MSRKDYKLIAGAISTASSKIKSSGEDITNSQVIDHIIYNLVNVLYQDNSRFNKDKFWDACRN